MGGSAATRHGIPAVKKREELVHIQSLDEMNRQLASHRLPCLARVGVERDGFTLLRIESFHLNPWYAIVEFLAERPDGTIGPYFLKFGVAGADKHACATIALITDEEGMRHVVFVRQNRPTAYTHPDPGRAWTLEVPREWAVTDTLTTPLTAKRDDGRAVSVLGRELTPLMLSGLVTVESRDLLSDVPENTGDSMLSLHYWLVNLRTQDMDAVKRIRGTRTVGIRYFPLDEVRKRRKELGINDAHTCTGLLLLYEHLGLL